MRTEKFVVRLVVVAALLVPASCLAEEFGWSLTCGLRTSESSGLGYESPSFGAWCWRDQVGDAWTLRTEVFGTTAEKDSYDGRWAASVLLEERRRIRDGRWWWGVGSEWIWSEASDEWTDRFTVSVGAEDLSEAGRGQAVTLRLLLPDSTDYETHGFLARWESRYPNWRLVLEGSEIAFEVPRTVTADDPDQSPSVRSWGRRVSVLFGRTWRGGE